MSTPIKVIKIQKKELPCHPCPHKAPCCKNGSNLTAQEAERIALDFGEHTVEKLSAPELRERFKIKYPYEKFGIYEQWVTAIKGTHCIFWDDGCKIYHSESYPRACSLYPWQGPDNPNYMASDAYNCPELNLPNPNLKAE